MPLSYPGGTLEEHRACRHGAVAFDVSHLGTVRVEGPDAFHRLQLAFTNDLGRIHPGRAQYTHLLDDADASVIDDIIVWWVAPEVFDVMPNASNTDRVTSALAGDGDLSIVDVTSTRAIIAVQGPQARSLVRLINPAAAGVERFDIATVVHNGFDVVVAGTGYTGEEGLEIAVPVAGAIDLWTELLEVGVVPAGLGARDTLRLEAGLPLHGHELGPGITSLQAGLGWVVRWDKGDFRGHAALAAERERGIPRRLRGLSVEGRRPPRADQSVLRNGENVGVITSGNFSPELGHGIALAFVPPDVQIGDELSIDIRGDLVTATVVKLPFVSHS